MSSPWFQDQEILNRDYAPVETNHAHSRGFRGQLVFQAPLCVGHWLFLCKMGDLTKSACWAAEESICIGEVKNNCGDKGWLFFLQGNTPGMLCLLNLLMSKWRSNTTEKPVVLECSSVFGFLILLCVSFRIQLESLSWSNWWEMAPMGRSIR